MKRLFLLALLVLFTLPIFAKHVSVETAQQVARNFWEQNVVKSTDVIFSDVTSQTEFTNFYIFNTDGGFVIVSADDIAYPVLGYSDESTFDTENIGINVLEWLRGYQRQIQFGIDNNIKATEEISDLWYKLQNGIPPMHKSTRAVSALMTTKWNQGPPYNLLCPYDDRTDENAVTGCVATAMAQVMKYWNYPTRGTGSYSYLYSSSYYPEQSADFENTTYDWNNMPDRLLSYSSQAEKDAVSTLMYHCGVSVGMNYGTVTNGGGSAAHTVASGYEGERCTELALKDNFGYKTSLQGLGREDYTGDWDNLLKAELNARRPIIYSGNGTGGGAGHCFVCDGYNDNDYFHFNWGWGGAYDGFFLTTALTPGGGGIGSDDDNNYSYRQAAVIGIEPAGVTVSPEIIEAASAGGNYSATVKAGTAASSWTSTSSASWLTISPTTGAGSEATTQITVTATANTGSAPRTATVTFSHGSTSPTILTVVQPDSYTESCVTMHEDRFSSPSMYYITAEIGYLFGVNTYGTQAYAEVFEATGNTNYDLNSIVFMYGVDGEEGSVTFKVWADNDGVPGGELASETVTLSELYAAGNVYNSKKVGYYTWTLNPSIVVPNKFFAGIDVSNATSGFALYSTTNDDEEYTNNNYRLLGSNWSLYNTGLSMYVLPTICPTEAPFYLLAALPSSLSYIADGGSKNITVNSNTNWTATSSADWLTLSPTSGSNNGTITAVAAANTSNGERTATITVSASGVNQQTISVTQADPSECFIAHEDRFTSSSTFLPTSIGYVCGSNSFGDQAKAELFELSSRYYNITSIDFMYCADGEEGSVTFKVWANNNGIPGDVLASKTVTLSELYSAGTVYGTSKQGIYTWTLTTPVTISGNFFAGIDVSSATSNIGLASTARGSGYLNSCYEFYNGRWSNMTPSWSNLDVSMYILPNLCPIASYVIVSPSSLSYSADGGSNDVTVSSNVNWTATSSENWLTMTPSSGSGNGSFSVVADANTSNGERTATITVSGEGASSQTISVTQADPNACVVLHEERFTEIPVIRNVGELSGGGIVCGKNNYTQACAELFEIADRYYNLTSIDFMYAADGDEGSITFKVWANNNGIPGDVLASKTVTLSTLYSAGTTMSGTRKQGLYTWTLTTPVAISGNFFAGIDVSNSTSYIGLFSTNRGSGYTNSNYKLNNGNWVTLTSFWNGFDCSMFVLPTACPIPSYNITVLANNDAYGEVAGGGTFSEGTQVTVSANPATGYNFVNWTENSSVVSTNANYTFTATAHRTLVANFEAITYTVTANANPAAGGSVTGAGSYTYGQTATLTATANTGYQFINWTDGNAVVSTDATYSFTVNGNRNLVANFQLNTYTISASANPVAGGTINGTGNYTHGQTATLTATANTGYNFVNWTENGTAVSTNATYSFTATDNRTLVANFEAISYTITANANPTEGGSVSGAGSYTYGQTATLNATANTGYHFVNWTDGNAVVSSEATYSFTVNGNRNLIANFQLNTYTISASASPVAGGTVNGAGYYTHGQNVTLSATANTGYNFVNWTENGTAVSTNATYSFTATNNRTLVANFEAISYTITANANPTEGGTVTGAGSYTYGQTATLTATANTGYQFINWTDGNAVVSSDATYSFTVNGNRTLVANFQINTYTITANANPVAGGTINGAGDYTHGQTVTLTATASTGYNFVNWTENGTAVSTNATYSFTATDNRTLVANFEAITYTISASASPLEGGTITGAGDYTYGQNVTLNAVANTGYTFVNWTENGTEVSTNAEYTFTANSNRNLVANFQINTYTITVTANPAEYGTVNGGGNYTHGQTVTLNAIANTNYSFVNWTENGSIVSTAAEYSFTATENRTLVANFATITYTITASASPVAGGIVTGSGSYASGQEVNLSAIANTGYNFTNWTENGSVVSTNAVYSFTATANRTLIANFELANYTISAVANPAAGGTINGAGSYTYGQTATLTATANTGYQFINWTDGNAVVSSDATYSFTVNGNRTLVANFQINTYTITANANPVAGGTINGAGDYTHGQTVTLTATASTGYNFVNWTENGTAVSTNATYSFTATDNRTLVANFEAITYTISANANPVEGGTITGAGDYTYGQNVTLNAVANAGYTFVNWTENGTEVSTNAEYSFTVNSNRNLVANFQINTYTITVTANPAEYGTVNGGGNYTHGQTVTLIATANTDYSFVNWTENGSIVSTAAEYSFTATENRTLVANFATITYTITASANPTEGGTVNGSGNYASGQTVNLNAVANTGYNFTNWTENGSVVSTNAVYSFTATANRTLIANFELANYTISAVANPAAGGTINGAGSYTYGQTATLTATANTGYQFINWTDGNAVVSSDATYSFTVNGNRNLVANFQINTYTITANANPAAGGTVNGAGDYTHGQTVTLTAIASIGYNFVNWTENGSVVSSELEYSFTATNNRTLVANFEANTYTISANANPVEGGTITGAGDYTYGQNVTLNAVANTGYTFVNWTENGTIVSTDVEYSFTANDDRTLVANFEINTYTITASANPTEYGTVSGAGNYTHGQIVTLIATANTDYSFVNWTENGNIVSTDAEYSFTATASRTLVANFATITYTITASASPVAGGIVTGSGSYASGQEVNLSAIANTGYNFTNWTENGSVVSTNADYSFTAEADRTLVANFTLNTYTISATANPTEGGTIEGADEYSHGETVILRATANTGYTFKNWTEGNAVVSTNAQYSFSATADRILVANFQINTYSINATANPTEGGTIEGADEYSHGETVTLIATANTGYTFTNWTEGNAVVSTDAQYSFTATADRTLVANFEINTYTITAIANPTEGGTIEGADEYSHGETVTLRATANTGYTFTNWTEGNAVVSTDAQYSFSATADRTLVANFEINTYTVTAVADPTEGGTVTIDIPSQNGVYNYGTNLVITATANEGYHFVQWNDGLTTAQRTYMVDANAEFIAYFVQNEATRYIIAATANPREGGTITGTGVYEADAQAVLTATANTGYTFTNWTENGTVVSTNAEYSFTVTTSRTLVANFELNTYTITASANPAEGGTMTGAGEYTHGQMVTLRATANAGYAFINWTENGSVVSNTASYMFEATADRALVANFDAVTYTINASANPADGGTITGTGNYAYGQNITLTATANDGYIFANWTENGFVVSSDAEYSFTVTSDRTLIANFGATTYSVTASANPTQGGTIDGAGDYVPGQTVYLIATANEGYTFVNWTENGSVVYTNPSYQFTAISDRTLVANFEINTYTIIASANPFAGGTIEGDGNYTYGQTATLTATANTGYEFVNWTEDNEIVSTDTEYSFTVTTNRRLVAHFGIGTYTISASANPAEGGTVEGADEYTYGQTATLRATANENYNFTNWTEDNEVVSTDAEYSFTVTADRNLVANFIYNEPAVYTITATANPTDGGTIEGAGVYREGETVSLSASARTGYHFVNWTENEAIVSTNAEYTFTARENRNLVANFQKDRYTVYITKNHLDGGTVEGDGEYEFGETATIIATANENYRFVNWTEAGEELSTEAEYSFEVTRDRYIVANFIYEMSVDVIELGSISVYPNPTSGMFKVEFGSITGDVTCQIVNASGSVIKTRELNVTDGSEVVFDCNVAPGVYFVRVISNDRVWTESIVINR